MKLFLTGSIGFLRTLLPKLITGREAQLSGMSAQDLQVFANHPRNLRMELEKAEREGIVFSSTEEGLVRALRAVL